MNPTAPAAAALLQTVWLHTFWNYMNACIQSGKEYQPHEQMNIAYLAACLADSVKQAFIERFVEVAPHGGGGVAPQSRVGDDFFDRLNTIGTQPPVVHEIDQALAKFHAASKPTAQFSPTPRSPK